MTGNKKLRAAVIAAAVAGVGAAVPVAFGDSMQSVNLDTSAGSSWMVSRNGATATSVVNVDSSYLLGSPSTGSSTPGGAWIGAAKINGYENQPNTDAFSPNHAAEWVSTDANAGVNNGDVNGTLYTYSDTFTLSSQFSGVGTLAIVGTLSSDNWVPQANSPLDSNLDGVFVTIGSNTYSIPVADFTASGALGQETMYDYAFQLAGLATFTSPQAITLSVNVVNSYEDTGNGINPGPTGLILAGAATATQTSQQSALPLPLPASAGVGFATIGMFGVLAAMRKRLTRKARIA
jgi:hypothetical protein